MPLQTSYIKLYTHTWRIDQVRHYILHLIIFSIVFIGLTAQHLQQFAFIDKGVSLLVVYNIQAISVLHTINNNVSKESSQSCSQRPEQLAR